MVSSLLAMDSAPVETDSTKGSCRFVKESQSLPLDAFASYYGHKLPQCALIDEVSSEEGTTRGGDYASESSDTLSTGQLVAVSAEKNVPTIHARVEGAQQVQLSIPVACKSLQVALLPPNDPETITVNRSWERTFTSVSEILASSTLPPAFKVMEQCSSYKSGCVETGVILFSIEVVRVGFRQQKAIQGTSMYGMKYTFLDGSRVFFSSRQCDTRCSLWECADIIRYPQKVTAFLNEEESREFPQLKNLSELTLTGKEEKKYLLMCKMKEDGSIERKLHTLPADSTTKVTAVMMKNCDLVKVASSKGTSSSSSKEHHRLLLPLPPTPPPSEYSRFEVQNSLVTRPLPCPDDEELYDEPDKLIQSTNSASTLLTEPDASTDSDPYVSLYPSRHTPTTQTVHGPDASDFETGIGTKKLEGSLLGGQGNETPPMTTEVQGALRMRCNTAPPQPTSSPAPVRRNTTCNGSGIQLAPVPSRRAPQSPRVHKKPIMLTSCPKEPELRYHVAAKLGQDWRSVCTYLSLPLHQIDQADAAHSQLEDKAMQGLVMWLRGQEDPEAPHSWNTLLQALHWAKRNDLASDVESRIKNGTLQLTQSITSRDL